MLPELDLDLALALGSLLEKERNQHAAVLRAWTPRGWMQPMDPRFQCSEVPQSQKGPGRNLHLGRGSDLPGQGHLSISGGCRGRDEKGRKAARRCHLCFLVAWSSTQCLVDERGTKAGYLKDQRAARMLAL